MAKLNTRFRHQLAQFTVDIPVPDTDKDLTRERVGYSFQSDGRILRKRIVWFKPGPYDNRKDKRHDYGWKLYKKFTLKSGEKMNSETMLELFGKYKKLYQEKGFNINE